LQKVFSEKKNPTGDIKKADIEKQGEFPVL
jgi:hypothetical protein